MLCVNNAYSEGREEKASRARLNHLFKLLKQTWMIFYYDYYYSPPTTTTKGALWSNHMNLLHLLTAVVTSTAELEQTTAVQ